MLSANYSFEELSFSSQLIRDLISKRSTVQPLINAFFDEFAFENQMASKDFSKEKRQVLVEALQRQNSGLKLSDASVHNIEALKEENVFTVTTGHQLNLLTGPLYSIYKIAQCIDLANRLNAKYPDKKIVPIFWMATEDHDFEEINHVHLFGEKIAWNKSDQENVIAGRIALNGIASFLDEIHAKFKDPEALQRVQELTAHYQSTDNLADASRSLINYLFGSDGIVIIDGDDRSLKKLFSAAMQKEVKEEVGYDRVMKTNKYLSSSNYHEQVFVRHINLFYIHENGVRNRLKKENNQLFVGENAIEEEVLIEEIKAHPERFSPNALYRPLYQESILPNLCYIGGGGEIAYWLQLKDLFAAHDLTFPLLRVRDSLLVYSEKQAALMNENSVGLMDLKLGVDQIVKDIALQETEEELDLSEAQAMLMKVKAMVMDKTNQVNKGLLPMVEGEFVKMIKAIEKIESKLVKAEKSKHEQLQKKLERLKDQFFPNGGFQERYDNIIPFYLKDIDFTKHVLDHLNSFENPQIKTIKL